MAYIAASLEEAGFDVIIIDLIFIIQKDYDVNEVKTFVLDLEPDIVGILAITSTISDGYKLAQAIKEEKKVIPVVVGGAHVLALPQRTIEECPTIDTVIVGDARASEKASNDGARVDSENVNNLIIDFKAR